MQLNTNIQQLLNKCQSEEGLRPLSKKGTLLSCDNAGLEIFAKNITYKDQLDNNEIIKKIKGKRHRKNKENCIKKTQLGEDQLTFTIQEYQKLEAIDQCHRRGISYCPVLPSISSQPSVMSAVERLKKMGRVDDVLHEIKRNLSWGEPLAPQFTINYLHRKQKGGFIKRKQPSNVLIKLSKQKSIDQLSDKYSLNKYYNTLLNKISFNKKKFLSSQSTWLKRNRVTGLSFAEKLQIIKEEADRNVALMCANRSVYMTDQRRNALYECQILRLSKKMLTSYEYEKLHFNVKQNRNQDSKKQDEQQMGRDSEQGTCRAQSVLQKNNNRIKAERRRVIEKLLC